jgi:hypothetical protein
MASYSPLANNDRLAPRVARVAMLFNPASAAYAEFWLKPFEAAAAVFAMQAISAPVRNESELASVIAEQAREPNSGLIVMPDLGSDWRTADMGSTCRWLDPVRGPLTTRRLLVASCRFRGAADIRRLSVRNLHSANHAMAWSRQNFMILPISAVSSLDPPSARDRRSADVPPSPRLR